MSRRDCFRFFGFFGWGKQSGCGHRVTLDDARLVSVAGEKVCDCICHLVDSRRHVVHFLVLVVQFLVLFDYVSALLQNDAVVGGQCLHNCLLYFCSHCFYLLVDITHLFFESRHSCLIDLIHCLVSVFKFGDT
jgi:hypothetical protein